MEGDVPGFLGVLVSEGVATNDHDGVIVGLDLTMTKNWLRKRSGGIPESVRFQDFAGIFDEIKSNPAGDK